MGILRTNTVSGLETPTPVTGSVVFDGTGDYLTLASSGDFSFGIGNFTIEWFQYWNSLSGFQDLLDINYTAGLLIETGNGDGKYNVYAGSNTIITAEPSSPETGKWHHYTLVGNRTAGTMTLYRNGVLSNSGSWATNINAGSASNTLSIGCKANGTNPVNGYISNLRVLKGTALYTSNFTPPTRELQPIGDTVLLCCNNSTSATAEATGKTITVNGNAAASTFSPGLVRDFTYGTQFSGVSRFDTQGYFVPPSGNTQNRYTLGLNEIVTSGLVLHLDAGNPFSYPATGVGTKWTDLSGNNNHGTLTNGVSYTENNRGALSFDGVDDYVNRSSSVITGNQSFSWGAWIYPSTTGTPVFFGLNSVGQAMVSFWDSSNNKVRVGTWGSDKLTSGTTILPSTWGYTFWTWDGTTLISYTNGVADGTTTGFTFNISSNNTTIGNAVNSQYFGGNISQVSIYNRALTAAEVLQNYEALKGRYGLP